MRADVRTILQRLIAARETEAGVDDALRVLLGNEEPLTAKAVEAMVRSAQEIPPATDVVVAPVDLTSYDQLLSRALPQEAGV